MATKFYFGRYWAHIRSVRTIHNGAVLYWRYKIYETLTDHLEAEGISANLDAACAASEACIDRLMAEGFEESKRAA